VNIVTQPLPQFVLITPARNEAAFIGRTIQAVASQTRLPVVWVIVDDGSTDATGSIVEGCASRHPWMRLVRRPPGGERGFGAKVRAFDAGLAELAGTRYDVIGNLDADITFEADYLEFLMGKFAEDARLGVAGTPFVEDGRRGYDYRFTSLEHVSGACQLFRRECYEEIGGYVPVQPGGIDLVAVLKARMKGWRTRTFVEKTCRHHRAIGTASHHPLVGVLKGGHGDYVLGSHPLWEVSRCVYQATRRPIVLGGLLRLAGFSWAMLTRVDKRVPPELVKFRRAEQMQRLRAFVLRCANPATYLRPQD
jgi:glycosyltransferase involved in cell wall biosynthesis